MLDKLFEAFIKHHPRGGMFRDIRKHCHINNDKRFLTVYEIVEYSRANFSIGVVDKMAILEEDWDKTVESFKAFIAEKKETGLKKKSAVQEAYDKLKSIEDLESAYQRASQAQNLIQQQSKGKGLMEQVKGFNQVYYSPEPTVKRDYGTAQYWTSHSGTTTTSY